MFRATAIICLLYCVTAMHARCFDPKQDRELEKLERRFDELTTTFNRLRNIHSAKLERTKVEEIISKQVFNDAMSEFKINPKLPDNKVMYCNSLVRLLLMTELRLTKSWKNFVALEASLQELMNKKNKAMQPSIAQYETIREKLQELNQKKLCYEGNYFSVAVKKVTASINRFYLHNIEVIGRYIDQIEETITLAENEYNRIPDTLTEIISRVKAQKEIKYCTL